LNVESSAKRKVLLYNSTLIVSSPFYLVLY
jgi:hypothetical protein